MVDTPDVAEYQLSNDWRLWVVDNALDGVDRDTLIATLVDGGIPRDLATREVDRLLHAAPLSVYNQYQRRIRRLEDLVKLWHHATDLNLDETDHLPSSKLFFRRYFIPGRPLLIRRAATDWPALQRWSMVALAERFGDVPIDIETHRQAAWNHEGRYETARLGQFLARLRSEPSYDAYCIARNHNMRRPELADMLSDISVDHDIFESAAESIARGSSLWIGGRTITPLHHDSTNILFHQIVGRKLWTLFPPSTLAIVDGLDGYYFRPGMDMLPADVPRITVTLSAGQALFVPAGWYHQVEALEPSVSFSLLNFRRPNDVSWFAPGKR